MAGHRFYAPKDQIDQDGIVLLADEAHHLARVLRLRPGDSVSVFDGQGSTYNCLVTEVKKEAAWLKILGTDTDAATQDMAESPARIILAQGLAKGDRFDFIVQKATELGVSVIVPLITSYTDVKLDPERADKKLDRWRRISLESLKQCGRSRLVEIDAPTTLTGLLKGFSSAPSEVGVDAGPVDKAQGAPDSQFPLVLLFSEIGGAPISEALASAVGSPEIVALVGPEGGWSDEELELMSRGGCIAVTLGPRILRTETAAIVALTLIQHRVGDLSRQR
jgi:16S rRNA (uracil1498-N3)-methyltransferase